MDHLNFFVALEILHQSFFDLYRLPPLIRLHLFLFFLLQKISLLLLLLLPSIKLIINLPPLTFLIPLNKLIKSHPQMFLPLTPLLLSPIFTSSPLPNPIKYVPLVLFQVPPLPVHVLLQPPRVAPLQPLGLFVAPLLLPAIRVNEVMVRRKLPVLLVLAAA